MKQGYVKIEENKLNEFEKYCKENGIALRLIENTGRPRVVTDKRFEEVYKSVLAGEITPMMAINSLKIPVGTYYRYKSEYDKSHGFRESVEDKEFTGKEEKEVR